MKYQILVGSLVCFLVSGSVVGTDGGAKNSLRKLNAWATKVKDEDKYEDPLSTLQDQFGGQERHNC